MIERRMFAKNILETDTFSDLSLAAQLLYVRMNLNADDEGFIPSIKRLARSSGATLDDIEALKASGLVIVFESGVAVVTDWRVHNGNLRADRTAPTIFAEKELVVLLPSGRYKLKDGNDHNGTKSGKIGQNRSKAENAAQQNRTEQNITEQKECSTRARERACATCSDSVFEKSSEENEEPETEPNRGGFFKGVVEGFDASQIDPSLYAELMKQAALADEAAKNHPSVTPLSSLKDKTEAERKEAIDAFYVQYTSTDVAERQADGLIFGRRALKDPSDYEANRAAYVDLIRRYGSREVLKAVEIALEAGHGGELGYIRGVLRRRAS